MRQNTQIFSWLEKNTNKRKHADQKMDKDKK